VTSAAPIGAGPGPGPHVVALGGGHGLAATLAAVRRYAGRITAVVSVADDGGSSGRLRRMTGMPAPGDIRRCLVALAAMDSTWSAAFAHRFGPGDLEGHTLGNLIIAGLAEVTGDFARAVDLAAELLGVTDRVLPATSVPVTLKADIAGAEVLGQANVTAAPGRITRVSLVPPDAPTSEEVIEAVATADQVVIGPGSLFTSVLATCVAPGIRAALEARAGGRVLVANLQPQVPETAGFSSADLLRAVTAHGVAVDVMVVDVMVVGDDLPAPYGATRVVTAPLAGPGRVAHDPALLAAVLGRLCREA
jgi:uncharacterized cofD-like protein